MVSKPFERPSNEAAGGQVRERSGELVPTLRDPWWKRQPEMAAFVKTLFGLVRVVDMPAACRERFPDAPAPSKSGIARYMGALRGGEFKGKKRRRARSSAWTRRGKSDG